MDSIRIEFPNPVLAAGRDDYIDSCSFYTTFDEAAIEVTSDDIVIPISYQLCCRGLRELIDSDKATVIVTVKSSAASYSRIFTFGNAGTDMVIRIPKYQVVRRIELTGSIVAKTAIKSFKCDGEFNALYFENQTFEIRKGDILAIEDSRIIYVDDSELERPISSIFTINNVPNQDDQIIPYFEGDKIEINLCTQLFDLYYDFKDFNNGSLRRYVTSVIVYPVLIEAISRICSALQTGDTAQRDLRWFRAIELKASKFGISMESYEDSYSTLANKLLGEITLDALQGFKDTLDSEMNSGETQIIGGDS